MLFCGNEFSVDVGYSPGTEPAPVACRDGISLQGAELSALQERFEKAGAVEGYATITGTWRDGTVGVRGGARSGRPNGIGSRSRARSLPVAGRTPSRATT